MGRNYLSIDRTHKCYTNSTLHLTFLPHGHVKGKSPKSKMHLVSLKVNILYPINRILFTVILLYFCPCSYVIIIPVSQVLFTRSCPAFIHVSVCVFNVRLHVLLLVFFGQFLFHWRCLFLF